MKIIFKNINPFNDKSKNSTIEFLIQKILAFIILYLLSAVILELIIIVIFLFFGFDVLDGQMPTGEWVNRIPFYGMAGFAFLTICYIKMFEKRKLSDIGIKLNLKLPIVIAKGIITGAGMVTIIIGILMASGLCSYQSISKFSVSSCLFWFLAYFIQSSAEEIMCRGFLQTSLNRRLNTKWSIFISSFAFAIPHVFTILEIEGITKWVAIFNLLLVSWLFSIVMLKENSLGAACGVHFGWNFCLGTIYGLEVSGGSSTSGILKFAIKSNFDFFTGGIYGIEASILIIPILCISIAFYTLSIIRKDKIWNSKKNCLN
jgi:membrane protease YdiL (CAAX protease family)